MTTKIQPLHDRVIVKRIDEGEQVRGGIIIPDSAKEKPQEGEVIAAGARQISGRRHAPGIRCQSRRPRAVWQIQQLGNQDRW